MARPPKVPNLLPLEQSTIYFVTICIEKRKPVLANPHTWNVLLKQFEKFDRWETLAVVAMPDHLHFLIAPLRNREESINRFVSWFKRGSRADLKCDWKWQEGSFDRLLRTGEQVEQKWEYMRQNPVRGGLVTRPEEWPYQYKLKADGA